MTQIDALSNVALFFQILFLRVPHASDFRQTSATRVYPTRVVQNYLKDAPPLLRVALLLR